MKFPTYTEAQAREDLKALGVGPAFGSPEYAAAHVAKHGFAPIGGGDFDLLEQLGLDSNVGINEVAAALAKATITTGISADALLSPEQADHFITTVMDADPFGAAIRVEPHDRASGSIDKIGIAVGLIRAAVENFDDGYRAVPTFGSVPFQVTGVRLPWEITLQFLRRNLEGQSIDDRIWALMTRAFGLDLSRLDILGDTASGDPSLSIDDGLLKIIAAGGSGAHRVNASNASLGVTWPNKGTLFAILSAMPEKYRGGALNDEGQDTSPLRWMASPTTIDAWTEYLTDRNTAAGDAALSGSSDLTNAPLGIRWMRIPQFPAGRIVLANPQNFVRVMGTQIERYRVGPDTDWELATRRKVGRIFFLDRDFVIEETDAVVDAYNVGS